MDNIAAQLSQLEALVEQRKAAVDKATAQLDVYYEQLKTEYNCQSLDEAKTLLQQEQQAIIQLEQEIKAEYAELQKMV